ncbi:MAG: hypothetical protein WCE79_14875 [Xanthobacteraceae bacterium]
MEISQTNIAVLAAIISALAAMTVGIVSAVTSVRIARQSASQKLAEMRQLWINELRNHIAEFIGTTHRILNESGSDRARESKTRILEELNAALMRAESLISMHLNHDEEASKRLVYVVAQCRGAAAHMSHQPTPDMTARIHSHLLEIEALSRVVLKSEWNRVKDEIKPSNRATRRARVAKLHEQLQSIENSSARYVHNVFNP